MPSVKRTHPRGPGLTYCALGTVMVLVVAVLAITAAQTPPPAIAELAPQATKQITEAPAEQTSSAGIADGGLGDGSATTTTEAPPEGPPVVRPRANRCVGSRQTEDPQSPPCVAFWEGKNGGATSKGVTANEIRIALPCDNADKNADIRAAGNKSPDCNKPDRYTQALEAYFNARYEFYGRKIRLIPYKHAGNNVACDKMLADATKVDAEINAFASMSYGYQRGRESCYYHELSRRKIISVQSSYLGVPAIDQAGLASFAPYEWTYFPTVEEIQVNLAEVMCKQLKDRAPAYAGGSEQFEAKRKFGLFTDTYSNGTPSVDDGPFLKATAACGIEFDRFTGEAGGAPDGPARAAIGKNALTSWRNNDITSIVCFCDHGFIINGLMQQSDINGYFPEYILQNYQGQENEYTAIDYGVTQQASHVIALRSWNKALPREQMPYWLAEREGDPTFPATDFNFDIGYWNLLLLVSGIQMAGPNLTPKTFEQALQRTQFPNPGCGGPPVYQACVGFAGGSHSMIKDFTLVWWNPNENGVEYTGPNFRGTRGTAVQPLGGLCFVDQGLRYRRGQWPAGPPGFRDLPCR